MGLKVVVAVRVYDRNNQCTYPDRHYFQNNNSPVPVLKEQTAVSTDFKLQLKNS